jgi:hypothetical protein
MGDRLIWKGKRPYWRSLCVRKPGCLQPVFYVEGDEVPGDILSRMRQDILDEMIQSGKIERVTGEKPVACSITQPVVVCDTIEDVVTDETEIEIPSDDLGEIEIEMEDVFGNIEIEEVISEQETPLVEATEEAQDPPVRKRGKQKKSKKVKPND